MESSSNFQEAANTSSNGDLAGGGSGDSAEDFEQSRFARTVASNNTDDVALGDFEIDVLQSPERLGGRPSQWLANPLYDRFTEGCCSLLVDDSVALRNISR